MAERLRVYVKRADPAFWPYWSLGVYLVTISGPINRTLYWHAGGSDYTNGRRSTPRPGRGPAERRALAWGIRRAKSELRALARIDSRKTP